MHEKENLENPVSGKEEPLFKKKEEKFRWSWRGFFLSFLWLAPLLIVLDQASKWAVVNAFNGQVGTSVEVIKDFWYITLVFNKGSSFGMGSDIPWMRYVYIVISYLGSAAILWYWIKNLKKHDTFLDVLLCFIFAGALGNGIDRLFYWKDVTGFDGVVDFFSFVFFGHPFAIFNVADMYLTCGIFVLVILLLYREIKGARKGKGR